MTAVARNALTVLALAVTLVLFVFLAPEPALREAKLDCSGSVQRDFSSMDACYLEQKKLPAGCVCWRPINPWWKVYWWFVPATLGVVAAALFQAHALPGTMMLVAAVVLTGGSVTGFLSFTGRIDGVRTLNDLAALLPLSVLSVAVYLLASWARRRWHLRGHAT